MAPERERERDIVRPKKRILIVTPDMVKASLVRFQLATWGYAPLVATNDPQARELLKAEAVDVCAIFCNGMAPLMIDIQRFYRSTNVLLVGAAEPLATPDVLLSERVTASEMREALRTLCCRRRGPHPHQNQTQEVGCGQLAAD